MLHLICICDEQLQVFWVGLFQRSGGGGSLSRLYKNNAIEIMLTSNKAPEYQEHVRETLLHLICDDQLEVWGKVGLGCSWVAWGGINSLVFNLPKNVRETVLHLICDDQLEVFGVQVRFFFFFFFFFFWGGGGVGGGFFLRKIYKENAIESINKAPEYQEHVREAVLHLICDDQFEVLQFRRVVGPYHGFNFRLRDLGRHIYYYINH